MRQYEYVAWCKQQLQAGTLRGQQLAIAQEIAGVGQETQPVHKRRGEVDEATGRVVDGDDADTASGTPWPLILGVLFLAGGAYWWFNRKGAA